MWRWRRDLGDVPTSQGMTRITSNLTRCWEGGLEQILCQSLRRNQLVDTLVSDFQPPDCETTSFYCLNCSWWNYYLWQVSTKLTPAGLWQTALRSKELHGVSVPLSLKMDLPLPLPPSRLSFLTCEHIPTFYHGITQGWCPLALAHRARKNTVIYLQKKAWFLLAVVITA